jgi:hypothetical protein
LTHFCHTNIIQYDLTEAEMRITPLKPEHWYNSLS